LFTEFASGYFAFGVSTVAGLASLLTALSSAFLTSGELPGLAGDPVGEAIGLGLAAAAGVGLAAGGFGGSGFGVSHAPKTAVETAKTDVNIIDLLIFSPLPFYRLTRHGPEAVRWQTSAAGMV